jgi:methylmalonyl-CoA/ethylmalonyl-CoA epimerase
MIKKIDHIGIAVKNLDEQVAFYTNIFELVCSIIEEVPEQQVRLAMFPIGETRIELLESTSENGPIAKFISKKGEGIHHIAYRIEDLAGNLKRLEEKQIQLINKEPKVGGDGHKIAFMHPKSTFGVLTELCE